MSQKSVKRFPHLPKSLTSTFIISLILLISLSSCKDKKVAKKSLQYVKTTVAEGIGQESMISYPGKTKA